MQTQQILFRVLPLLCLAAVFSSCSGPAIRSGDRIDTRHFGVADGKPITLYTLRNSRGVKAQIMDYGAILYSLELPDRHGKAEDVTLGYAELDEYVRNRNYFGATIGRYANRIAKGKFILDGAEYTLATNNNENHLHGGVKGFNKVVWDSEAFRTDSSAGVRLRYRSRDGEEGYPGNLECTVVYTLTNDNELRIDYEAATDKPTPVNLTNHTFWNLSGGAKRDILEHKLTLNADYYLPVDDGLIPTGEILRVQGTPMDFTKPAAIGSRIDRVAGGYDHNYVLSKPGCDRGLNRAAVLYDPQSGRRMEILTTQPGIQFYSGNFLDGTVTGKDGVRYKKYHALCLETQHFPDSPNKSYFPTAILKPGERYEETCLLRFSVQ